MAKLEPRIQKHVDLLVSRYPALGEIQDAVADAYLLMQESYEQGGKLLVAGNGGSASDSEHIVGELMKSFRLRRPVTEAFARKLTEADAARGAALAGSLARTLTAVSLTAHEAVTTAVLNDVGAEDVFAQQMLGYGRPGDVFLGISTSGNSENIMRCTVVARALGIRVIGLTGRSGGSMAEVCDVTVKVPETETYRIQEYHLPIYHCWCLMLEDHFFGEA